MTVSLCIKQEVEVGLPVFVLTLYAKICVAFLKIGHIFLCLLHVYGKLLVIIAHCEDVNNVMKNLYIAPSKIL